MTSLQMLRARDTVLQVAAVTPVAVRAVVLILPPTLVTEPAVPPFIPWYLPVELGSKPCRHFVWPELLLEV